MGRNKKSVGLLKDKFGGQVMKEFVGLRPKTYSYLKDNNDAGKKQKVKKLDFKKKKTNFKIIKIA